MVGAAILAALGNAMKKGAENIDTAPTEAKPEEKINKEEDKGVGDISNIANNVNGIISNIKK